MNILGNNPFNFIKPDNDSFMDYRRYKILYYCISDLYVHIFSFVLETIARMNGWLAQHSSLIRLSVATNRFYFVVFKPYLFCRYRKFEGFKPLLLLQKPIKVFNFLKSSFFTSTLGLERNIP